RRPLRAGDPVSRRPATRGLLELQARVHAIPQQPQIHDLLRRKLRKVDRRPEYGCRHLGPSSFPVVYRLPGQMRDTDSERQVGSEAVHRRIFDPSQPDDFSREAFIAVVVDTESHADSVPEPRPGRGGALDLTAPPPSMTRG